jgi:GTP cyclohydrolase FolE2
MVISSMEVDMDQQRKGHASRFFDFWENLADELNLPVMVENVISEGMEGLLAKRRGYENVHGCYWRFPSQNKDG